MKDELFVPYAYREGQEFDYFLILNQANALKKLFESGLKIIVEGEEMMLVVKTSVAIVRNDHKKLSDEII